MRILLVSFLFFSLRRRITAAGCAQDGEKALQCNGKGKNVPEYCCDAEATCNGQVCADPNNDGGGGGGGGGGSDECPVTLKTDCIAWVTGKSGKLHVLVKAVGSFSDGRIEPVNGAIVFYETRINSNLISKPSFVTDAYVFGGYQSDFLAQCGDIDGVTTSAHCFQKTNIGDECIATVVNISMEGCEDSEFDSTDSSSTCVFAGGDGTGVCQ